MPVSVSYYEISIVYKNSFYLIFSLLSAIVWILTRNPFPGDQIVEQAVQVLKDNDISLTPLQVTNQIACNSNLEN